MRLIQRPAFLYVLALLATAVHCEEAAAPQAAPPKIFPPEIVTATLACKAQWDEACDDKKIITAPPGHKICQHEVTVVQQSGDSQYQEAASDENKVKSAWQAPLLQKFTDMQALLLLDPIHEVDSAGWPQPKPEEQELAQVPSAKSE